MAVLMRGLAAGLALVVAAVAVPLPARADEIRARQGPVIRTLSLEKAWRTTRGKGVTVAVIDSGVDPRQADLKGSVTTGPNMLESIDGDNSPARLHGTGMASLIAGHGHGPGGRDGVIGVAPQARILAIRAIAEREDSAYRIYHRSERAEDAVAKAVRYAADHGADIINLSLGKYEENPDERAAIAYAIGKGVVVVSAAGNDGDEREQRRPDGFAPYSYPAAYPGVIAVAATTSGHDRARFSNRNYSVLLSAPGAGLLVAGPGDRYFVTDGTSDSSALVSGIAALIRSRHPDLSPALVTQALIKSTQSRPDGTYSPGVGFGEVDAARALAAADTLAKAGGAKGQPAKDRFGAADPQPVEVVPRPGWFRVAAIVLICVGFAGGVAALVIARRAALRNRRAASPGLALPPIPPPDPSPPPDPRGPEDGTGAGEWPSPDPMMARPPSEEPRA